MMERDGLVFDMSEVEYHAPKVELSSTGAKLLLDSPARFKHVVLDGNRTEKRVWDLGAAVHGKVLGTGAEAVAYPEDVLSASGAITAKAKEWAIDARAEGLVPVKQAELDEINAVSESLLANITARTMLEAEGDPEVSAFATCPETGVRLRGRYDYRPKNLAVLDDVKTVGRAGGASEAEFTKQIFNFGYDVQAGQYTDIHKYITGEERDFAFIVVEMVAPYLVNVITMSEQYLDMGRVKSMEARRRYRHGLDTGEWPGYSLDIKRVEPPMYAVYDFQDNYEDGGEMTF